MRFNPSILIIGAGACLAGLIGAFTGRPVIILNKDTSTNDVAVWPSRINLPEPRITENIAPVDFSELDFDKVSNTKWVPKFGHPKRKTNKLRCKHNAKLKRR